MRILVFMSDNRILDKEKDKASYNSLVAAINYDYCKKHNYDFIYYRPYLDNKEIITLHNCVDPNTNTLRHASWAKQLSTALAFELDYDYVVYIDSDCIFKNFDMNLESIIMQVKEIINDKDIIFFNNKPWGDNVPCGGFYIAKVCDYSKQFFMDWFNVNVPKYNKKHAWEQDALWLIFTNYNIVIVDAWMFREMEGQFLRHVGCCDDSNDPNHRVNYFTKFIDDKHINYETNINEIKCIDFNTNKDAVIFEHPITNKSYFWRNTVNKITFLEGNEMDAFGWGYYKKIDNHIFKAYFGGREHTLVFSDDYTNFTSIRRDDHEVIKGSLV
jgi:hypothetical protein